MLRLRKLRTQRDPTSTSATEFVAQRTSERHRRSVGTMDVRSRPTAGRRRTAGECVRCTRKATWEEPDAGRTQTPAEVALRLLILKHVRNWSYDTLEREGRANLVYRAFTRIGDEKGPDAKTLALLGQVIGPEVLRNLHERLVELARKHGVVKGRRMRVDTTVVETNIHYPTDSSLLGDGARVLTRTMKKIEANSGGLGKKIRDRMRTVKKRV